MTLQQKAEEKYPHIKGEDNRAIAANGKNCFKRIGYIAGHTDGEASKLADVENEITSKIIGLTLFLDASRSEAVRKTYRHTIKALRDLLTQLKEK